MYRLDDDTAIIQTLDFFPPIVDDPYLYGQIAAANALSDVYAMGGRPLLALNIVGFPIDLPKEILGEILRGGGAKAQEAGVLIVGRSHCRRPGAQVRTRRNRLGIARI